MTNTLPYQIGSIVAIHTHPFFSLKDSVKIFLEGDTQFVPPLMVITEMRKPAKSSFDGETGENIEDKFSDYNCKCIWFSSKSFLFQESWFSSKLLKTISAPLSQDNSVFKVGSAVEFCLSNTESSKSVKSVRNKISNHNHSDVSTYNITSFGSPLLIVTGTKKNEIKEPKFDTVKGGQIRFFSEKLIKCKYYNAKDDKYSEVFLPWECLVRLEEISEELIKAIIEKSGENYYFYVNHKELSVTKDTALISSAKISSHSGRYFIFGYCLISCKYKKVQITNLNNWKVILEPFKLVAPIINQDKLHDVESQIINDSSSGRIKKVFLIKYSGKNSDVSTRIITGIEIVTIPHDTGSEIIYLRAHCHLRQAERHFRLDRIISISVLNIENFETIIVE